MGQRKRNGEIPKNIPLTKIESWWNRNSNQNTNNKEIERVIINLS